MPFEEVNVDKLQEAKQYLLDNSKHWQPNREKAKAAIQSWSTQEIISQASDVFQQNERAHFWACIAANNFDKFDTNYPNSQLANALFTIGTSTDPKAYQALIQHIVKRMAKDHMSVTQRDAIKGRVFPFIHPEAKRADLKNAILSAEAEIFGKGEDKKAAPSKTAPSSSSAIASHLSSAAGPSPYPPFRQTTKGILYTPLPRSGVPAADTPPQVMDFNSRGSRSPEEILRAERLYMVLMTQGLMGDVNFTRFDEIYNTPELLKRALFLIGTAATNSEAQRIVNHIVLNLPITEIASIKNQLTHDLNAVNIPKENIQNLETLIKIATSAYLAQEEENMKRQASTGAPPPGGPSSAALSSSSPALSSSSPALSSSSAALSSSSPALSSSSPALSSSSPALSSSSLAENKKIRDNLSTLTNHGNYFPPFDKKYNTPALLNGVLIAIGHSSNITSFQTVINHIISRLPIDQIANTTKAVLASIPKDNIKSLESCILEATKAQLNSAEPQLPPPLPSLHANSPKR